MVKINCKYNDGQAWCRCSKVKRKLWGIGARMCVEFENTGLRSVKCQFKEEFPKPASPPPPPPQRIRDIDSVEINGTQKSQHSCSDQPSVADKVALIFEALNNKTSRLECRIRTLEETLSFYADARSYEQRQCGVELSSAVELDDGVLARNTLNQENTNESQKSEV